MNLGFLIDSDAVSTIEKLNEEDFYRLVEGLKKEKSFIFSNSLIKRILSREISIIKKFEPKKVFTIQDFIKTLNERYDHLQNILLKKLELADVVSINKCSSGDVSIIGLVKSKEEKDNNYIVSLEDPTGEIQVVLSKNLGEKLALDDVVAVSGKINNKILFAEKLIHPDVPLRAVNYSSETIKVAFLSDERNCDANYIVYRNKIEDRIKNRTYEITNPTIIEVENVVILIIFDSDSLEALRKRYVNIENTDFTIEPIPDIVFTNKEINTNYKGITIVSLNKSIDLKTREVTIV
jgi:hypothetical protein